MNRCPCGRGLVLVEHVFGEGLLTEGRPARITRRLSNALYFHDETQDSAAKVACSNGGRFSGASFALILPEYRHDLLAQTPRRGQAVPQRGIPPRVSASSEIRPRLAGNKTEIIRQIGNAVPVNTAAALVGAMMEERRGR